MYIDMRDCYREDKEGRPCYGSLYSVYIFRKRKWEKIGEVCSRCGFHLKSLKEIFPYYHGIILPKLEEKGP